MIETVLPLEMILFQVLFLLVAIALESRILYRKLRISRKTSLEYAMSINFLATGIGWLGFFALQNVLTQPLKSQVISYIFFDRLIGPQGSQWNSLIILVGIAIFFFTFMIKLLGLQLLHSILQTTPEPLKSESIPIKGRRRLLTRLEPETTAHHFNPALVILMANAYSYSAILFLLFLRFIQFNRLV